ncbi:MAG: glutathione peroxidase [Chitinophagales bacterium]|nr:glutathione peroxidase [Chitinophagales bacterium]
MKRVIVVLTLLIAIMGLFGFLFAAKKKDYKLSGNTGDIYQFTMKSIDGKEVPLSNYKGKVVIIVNTASKCGLTPQYEELEKFYEQYKDKNVAILGFPANNFLWQEPGSDDEIKSFCQKNYGVTFDMFSKISVKGNDIHPLYQFLTSKSLNGAVDAPVSWNFQKFIINKNGKVVTFVSPKTSIYDKEVVKTIEAEIAK